MVDTSTIGIEASENVHKAFADAGIDFVDAPVSGGVSGAVAATISLMFSGEQATLERLRDLRPDLAVVLSSGYGSDVLSERVAGGARIAILPKPYRAEDLLASLEQVLGD